MCAPWSGPPPPPPPAPEPEPEPVKLAAPEPVKVAAPAPAPAASTSASTTVVVESRKIGLANPSTMIRAPRNAVVRRVNSDAEQLELQFFQSIRDRARPGGCFLIFSFSFFVSMLVLFVRIFMFKLSQFSGFKVHWGFLQH